ncbi:DMT family transporter [Microbacterium sp. CIAB417]|uniref:DMT family transporter n=1 Tax=Microbacterium sp. CIAB417 TaxID=2860287 RepID=UPI001FAD19AE|nr:DMT family transporter [Microbacterium sp. CIAB417]
MRRLLRALPYTACAVLGGSGVAFQAGLMGDVAAERSALPTSTAMFLIGTFVLAVAVLCTPRARVALLRLPATARRHRIAGRDLLNGLGGAATIIVQAVAVGPLGVAMFTLGMIGGQIGGGLALDAIGATGRRIPIGPVRLLSGALVLIAVALSSANGAEAPSPVMLGLAIGGGVVGAWVGAASSRVHRATGSLPAAALLNFAVGATGLIIATVALGEGAMVPSALLDLRLIPAAVLGIVAISVSTLLVVRLGVLGLAVCWTIGQLATAIALDALRPGTFSWLTVVSAALMLLALVLMTLRAPSPRAEPSAT